MSFARIAFAHSSIFFCRMRARIAELRHQFVDGPVLVLPGGGGGLSNPLGAAVILCFTTNSNC
jgi:hypothetical protein